MKRSLRAGVVVVVASLLVCSLLAPALVGAPVAAQSDSAEATALAVSSQEFDADSVAFEIAVFENGSATWTFRYMSTLESDGDRQNFEAYAAEFETNETELYTAFRDGATRLTANGSAATGREMNATNFQREAYTEGLDPAESTRGVVAMSFRWDGFARVDDRVVMGDVFEGGLYLAADQQLVVRTGPNLAFGDVQPDDGEFDEETMTDSDAVTWDGGSEGVAFNPGRPRVEFVEPGSTADSPASPAASSSSWTVPLVVLLLAVLLGVGVVAAYRSDSLPSVGGRTLPGSSDDGGAGSGVSSDTPGSDAGGAAAQTSAGVPDEELVSDEERVVTLLEDNDGRMKQVNIVEETGWSKSKVSMLLSDMEEEGTISKLRVGRENIVSLAGHEPTAAGSPFDDDDDPANES